MNFPDPSKQEGGADRSFKEIKSRERINIEVLEGSQIQTLDSQTSDHGECTLKSLLEGTTYPNSYSFCC